MTEGLDPNSEPANRVVTEWITKASNDLDTAHRESRVTQSPNHDAVCFHAQQCVEKLMKAAIVSLGAVPPKTHDLAELERCLQAAGLDWNWPNVELRALTLAAVYFRYPHASATQEDAADYLTIAQAIWHSLRPLI